MGMLRKYASSRRTTLLSLSAVQREVVKYVGLLCWKLSICCPALELPTKGRSSDAQDFMDLFDQHRRQLAETEAPLAARMRPRTLDEFIGQDQMIGPGRLLRRAIIADQLSSLIFTDHQARARQPWLVSSLTQHALTLLQLMPYSLGEGDSRCYRNSAGTVQET